MPRSKTFEQVPPPFPSILVTIGREPIEGIHHGRLAFEQTYGYLVFDKILYGVMTTFNSFVFLKRESPGILYMSNTIPIDFIDPTILKLLYFFSHLCALNTDEHPEINAEGNPIHLRNAEKTAERAPKIPDPNYIRPYHLSPPVTSSGVSVTPRRSPRFQESMDQGPVEQAPAAQAPAEQGSAEQGPAEQGPAEQGPAER